jgi:hypothetical protein
MPTVDDQLAALLRDAAPRPTTSGLDQRLARRRRARALRKRIGDAALIVVLLTGTVAGFVALSRAFEAGRIPLGKGSLTATPSPLETTDEQTGIGALNCQPQRMTGDVDGDGSVDVVRFSSADPCGRERHVVISSGHGASPAGTTLECNDPCVLFSVTDLNADGIDEILVFDGSFASPLSGWVSVYEAASDGLVPVTFPGGSNGFPLRDLWTGFRGAYCERSRFLLWFAVGPMSYETPYRLDPSTSRFLKVGRTVTRPTAPLGEPPATAGRIDTVSPSPTSVSSEPR